MLKTLYIQNFALIDKLEVDFRSGFSVISGETGAGKSIILGALSLILGQRADSKTIKKDESKCVIEGCFDVSEYGLKEFFEKNDIEYDAENCLMRRELTITGKSRAFINDTPVGLNTLKELGCMLIDIHSQHQNLLLSDASFQLRVVDILANNKTLLENYRKEFSLFRKYKAALKEVTARINKDKEEADYVRFQYDQLSDARLVEDEQPALENELNTLSHAEEIKTNLFRVNGALSDGEGAILDGVRDILHTLNQVSRIYAEATDWHKRLESNYIDLKDIAAEIESASENIEYNPQKQLQVEGRLSLIYSLQQKHRVKSIAELLTIQTELEERLTGIESSDEELHIIQEKLEEKQQIVTQLAEKLTESRRKASKAIAAQLAERVAILGIPNAKIELRFEPKTQPDEFGAEAVWFYFSANKNTAMQPVSEIASGGEISRLMLCIKAMIANAGGLPTIIFDEIDTGVSGEIADKMGVIMWEMSKNMQVISITHLPQIASKGEQHYRVYKEDLNESTYTRLRELKQEERTAEVARMLSGAELTQAALLNAQELINQWKKAK